MCRIGHLGQADRPRGDEEGDCRLEREPLVTMMRLGVFAEQDTRRKELRK